MEQNKAHQQARSNLLLFITALIWGVAFVAQRKGMESVGAFTFGAVRFALGSAAMLPLLPMIGRREAKAKANPTGEAKARLPFKKVLPFGLLLGAVLFTASTLQQVGLYTTTAGKAGFITDLYIIIVPLIEIFLGRKPKKIIFLCAAMAVAGLYLISVTGNFTVSRGDVLVLIGSFFWAAHILLVDRFAKKYNPVLLSILQYAVTSLLSVPFALAFEKITLSGILDAAGPIVYAGIFSTSIAYTLQVVGQRHAKAAHAAIIMSMESVFSFLAGVLLLHEPVSARSLSGCALMAAAMVLTATGGISPRFKKKKAAARE